MKAQFRRVFAIFVNPVLEKNFEFKESSDFWNISSDHQLISEKETSFYQVFKFL